MNMTKSHKSCYDMREIDSMEASLISSPFFSFVAHLGDYKRTAPKCARPRQLGRPDPMKTAQDQLNSQYYYCLCSQGDEDDGQPKTIPVQASGAPSIQWLRILCRLLDSSVQVSAPLGFVSSSWFLKRPHSHQLLITTQTLGKYPSA